MAFPIRVLIVVLGLILLTRPAAAQPTASDALEHFDPALPGYGIDNYWDEQPVIHDMALCWYGVAVARMGNAQSAGLAGDQIIAISEKGGPSAPGWGLGFPVDAFGDGTMNDAVTVYGITTAICTRALFDIYDLTDDSKYLDRAIAALDYYHDEAFIESTTGPNGGFFWYSDRAADRTYTVHNVTAMLMGQYARAWSYTQDADYKDAAERSARYLWARQDSASAGIKWDYKYGNHTSSGNNDEVHAAFIVQGFLDYDEHLSLPGDITPAIDYLADMASTMPTRVQRLWGTGMMIYTLTDAGRLADADDVIEDVLPMHGANFVWKTDEPDAYLRHTAYLLAALALRESVD